MYREEGGIVLRIDNVCVEKLERYLEEDGEICPGKGMTIAIKPEEKPVVDEAMQQLEALGFDTENVDSTITRKDRSISKALYKHEES